MSSQTAVRCEQQTGECVYLQLQLVALHCLQVLQRLLAQAPPPVLRAHSDVTVLSQ